MHELQTLAEKYLGRGYMRPNGEHYFHCPFCNHKNPKLSLHYVKIMWNCFVCKVGGRSMVKLFRQAHASPEDLKTVYALTNTTTPVSSDAPSTQIAQLPSGFTPLWETGRTLNYRAIVNYAKMRRLTVEDIYRYNIGYSTSSDYEGHIIIPSYFPNGSLNYYVSRQVLTSHIKYRNCNIPKTDIIMFHSLIDWNSPVVLCEGVFDAISMRRNVIPLLGKFVSDIVYEELLYRNTPELIIALDPDAFSTAMTLAKDFMSEGRPVRLIKIESDTEDAADLGFEHMTSLITNASPLTFKKLLEYKLT